MITSADLGLEPLKRAEWVQHVLDIKNVQTVYEMARRGIIPSVRNGRSVRFDPEQIRQYIHQGGRREPDEVVTAAS